MKEKINNKNKLGKKNDPAFEQGLKEKQVMQDELKKPK